MASFAKQFSFFLLLTLLFSLHTHARDSQFFNKVPSTTNKVVVPNNKETVSNQQEQQDQPNFLPENENAYGLYGHESGQLPPSATTSATVEPAATSLTTNPYNKESRQPVRKYLPKNYNPVAYVTEPEEIKDNNNNNYYNGVQNYNNNQLGETEYRSHPTTTNTRDNNNYYYKGGSSFNSKPQGMSDTRYSGSAAVNSREKYFNNGGQANGFREQPQGMSDTRFVENGMYFYDVNTEKYNSNHPYESFRGVPGRNEYNNRNHYGNSENINSYEFNGENPMGGYQNEEEFQEEDTNMP